MEELEAIISAIDDIVFEFDQDGRYAHVWTNSPEKLFYPASEILGKTVVEALGSESAWLQEAVFASLQSQTAQTLEYPSPHDPRQIFEARLVFRRKNSGQASVIVAIRDISAKKNAEKGTEQLQRKYILERKSLENFLDIIPAVVIWLDSDLKYKSVNKVFADGMNLSQEELIGKEVGFSHFQSGKKLRQLFLNLLASSEESLSQETDFEDGHGGVRIYQVHARKVGDRERPDIVFIGVDVDRQRKTEKLLEAEKIRSFHSARLVSLGEMAGGIAHEIKNPLSIISGNIELARREIVKEEKDLAHALLKLDKAHQTIYRIAKIVDSMTRLSRFSDRDEFRWVGISAIVDDTISLCSQKMQSRQIQFSLEMNVKDGEIFCLREQLSQILVNLLMNALDATAEKESPWVKIKVFFHSDKGLYLEVHDNGPGVKNVDKLFNPFYTTKDPGSGTGLGLSISLKIAQAHDGAIHYEREDGTSVFSLCLPSRVVRFLP